MSTRLMLGLAIAAALTFATAAAADNLRIHFTAAGQRRANRAVLTRTDVGGTRWARGPREPVLTSTPSCGNFTPKQSDLVVVGAAASRWRYPTVSVDSQAMVFQSSRMARLEWARTVTAPAAQACRRRALAQASAATLITYGRTPFPELTSRTRAYRAVMGGESGGRTFKQFTDFIVIGKGPTEVTITVSSLLVYSKAVMLGEVAVARAVVSRIS